MLNGCLGLEASANVQSNSEVTNKFNTHRLSYDLRVRGAAPKQNGNKAAWLETSIKIPYPLTYKKIQSISNLFKVLLKVFMFFITFIFHYLNAQDYI